MFIVCNDRGSDVQGFFQFHHILAIRVENLLDQGRSEVIPLSSDKHLPIEFVLVINDAPQKIFIEFKHHLPHIWYDKINKVSETIVVEERIYAMLCKSSFIYVLLEQAGVGNV